jgi:hypothetical protein
MASGDDVLSGCLVLHLWFVHASFGSAFFALQPPALQRTKNCSCLRELLLTNAQHWTDDGSWSGSSSKSQKKKVVAPVGPAFQTNSGRPVDSVQAAEFESWHAWRCSTASLVWLTVSMSEFEALMQRSLLAGAGGEI